MVQKWQKGKLVWREEGEKKNKNSNFLHHQKLEERISTERLKDGYYDSEKSEKRV